MMTERGIHKRPARFPGRGAVIVHGHRLSSLFRRFRRPRICFGMLNIVVLKILNSLLFGQGRRQWKNASGGSIWGTTKRGVA